MYIVLGIEMAANFFPVGRPKLDFSTINSFFVKHLAKIVKMNITTAQKDQILKMNCEMLTEIHNFQKGIIAKYPKDASEICEEIYANSKANLSSIGSQYKRNQIMKKSQKYVEPVELSSGFKFSLVTDNISGRSVRSTVQCTFQFVSLLKTLTALFSDDNFEKLYFDFNRSSDHNCADGSFERFCCGDVYKRNSFFQSNPLAIQLKLFIDDFEPCAALKSRVGKHKTTGIYIQISNMPQKYLSKVDNIYLLALCDASDTKNEYANTNNVIETIVSEINDLQKNGINTISGVNLKGTLIYTMFDNLGGNALFGLSGSFSSTHFCRFCCAENKLCQQMTTENASLVRTVESYNNSLEQAQADNTQRHFEGIKSHCFLNEIKHFHIMENITVDIMHDILEGIIPFTLEEIFNHCVREKIVSDAHLQSLVECFDFGSLHKANNPSKLGMEKKNLGQSASQSYCLMINMPYILFQYKENLLHIWQPMSALLQILQIAISYKITDSDLRRLETLITEYLSSYMECFNKHLKPKQHLLLHYPRVIRMMGPIIFMWVMRMESKHQVLKQIAQSTKNFINLKKTMATKHQEKQFVAEFSYCDEIIISKKTYSVFHNQIYEAYQEIFDQHFTESDICDMELVNSVEVNSFRYRAGYLIPHACNFSEINHIISLKNKIWFLCNHHYSIQKYDSFLNSFLLQKNEGTHLVSLLEMKSMQVYEKKYLKCDTYLVVENLELYHMSR